MDNACKLATHRLTVNENSLPVVFCVRCGSTCIDQNSITELRCYTCDNRMPWNADLFSIRRGLDGEHDVASAFFHADKRAEKTAAIEAAS